MIIFREIQTPPTLREMMFFVETNVCPAGARVDDRERERTGLGRVCTGWVVMLEALKLKLCQLKSYFLFSFCVE